MKTKRRGFGVWWMNKSVSEMYNELQDLDAMGVNIIRYQVIDWNIPENQSEAQFRAFIEPQIDKLALILPHAQARNIVIVFDMHTPPLGTDWTQPTMAVTRIFKQPIMNRARYRQARTLFVKIWKEITIRFKGQSHLWFDLMNEPAVRKHKRWVKLYKRTVKAIRRIDKNRQLVIETPTGSPRGFKNMEYIDDKKIFWSPHYYEKHSIVSQDMDNTTKVYPSRTCNPSSHIVDLKQARDWQQKHNARIYWGEVGCFRWSGFQAGAHNASYWFKDVLNQIEEYGHDYTIHAYNESHHWRYDFGNDPSAAGARLPNPIWSTLQTFFIKNN